LFMQLWSTKAKTTHISPGYLQLDPEKATGTSWYVTLMTAITSFFCP
jgi:hypothetical protein